ncbi:MAG: hypothetical protein R3E79_13175 [Caldilineaceae bacterium]
MVWDQATAQLLAQIGATAIQGAPPPCRGQTSACLVGEGSLGLSPARFPLAIRLRQQIQQGAV